VVWKLKHVRWIDVQTGRQTDRHDIPIIYSFINFKSNVVYKSAEIY